MGNHGEIIVIIMGKSWEEDRKIMDSYGIRLEVLVFRNETTPNFDLSLDIPIQQGSVGMVYYRRKVKNNINPIMPIFNTANWLSFGGNAVFW